MSNIKYEYIDFLRRRGNGESRGVGAPKGGRVHWLLLHLTPDFKGKYILHYDYKYHNYVFLRYEKRKLLDIFIVIRTSIHGWRCMYFNAHCLAFERCSTRKSDDMARCITLIAETYGKTYPQKETDLCTTRKKPENPYKQRLSSDCVGVADGGEDE